MSELKDTLNWFVEAVREPTPKNKVVQVGCHVEEYAEMLEAIGMDIDAQRAHSLGNGLKDGSYSFSVDNVDRKELLDSLCDQIVTAVGIAHMFGLDVVEGLNRVNASNYSKFVDGKAVFDANGKIKKGPNYFKPSLEGLY